MTVRILALAALSLTLFSCQKSDKDILNEAQSCLNTAPASEARACVSELASMNTPAANRLKCSAIYISEGFREAKDFIDAIDKLKDDGSGCANCSGTLNAMNALNFSKGDNLDINNRERNKAVANEAFDVCSKANSKGYTQISSLFKLGTTTSMLAYDFNIILGGDPPTTADLEQVLDNIINNNGDPALIQLAKETVGELAMTSYQTVCLGNQSPSDSTVKYCDELSVALQPGNNSAEDIGACLIKKIHDKDALCP